MKRSNYGLTKARFMPHPSAVALSLLASATVAGTPVPAGQPEKAGLAQVTIRGSVIMRIRAMPLAPAGPTQGVTSIGPMRWVEKKGPKCIPAGQLGGAIVNGNSVDLVLRGGDRVRAVFDGDCAGLGYYGGFYLKPSSDGQLCAGRDSIRTRSGDSCTIKRFHKLVAKR